jgi:signal peptidase I
MYKKDHAMAAGQGQRHKTEDGLWETIKVIIQALLIAFFVRTFFYQPFNIPSASMYPTLKIGDYLFVSKLSYGYGKYSFNFSFSVFGTTLVKCCSFVDFPGRAVLADDPQRGDVAVFKLPNDTDVDYIKRVIGLPGDRIQMKGGVLFINGEAVKKEPVGNYANPTGEAYNTLDSIPEFRETLPNGISYFVLDAETNGSSDDTGEYLVPPGHYFMMGDNRDNSQDSRFQNVVGYVPVENFVGRADIVFFSISPEASIWEVWKWPFAIRWSRFFTTL